MGRREIVAELAAERRVERMVQSITHSRELTPDLRDLSQIVYLALLEMPEDKLTDLWESNSINFLIARIIINQYRSSHSPFRDEITRFRSLSEELQEIREATR